MQKEEIVQGGVISRLSAAYRALRPEEPGMNPLKVYEPFTTEQVKALRFPQASGRSYVRTYSSWDEFNRALNTWSNGADTINYAQEVDVLTSPLVMAAVRWVGNTLPEATLQVKESAEMDAETIPNHPMVQRLKRPNKYYSGSTLWKAYGLSWILSGNVYFLKFRDGMGRVTELWYEPHWTIRPRWWNDNQGAFITREGDDLSAFIVYYEIDREGQKYRVEVSGVVHFRDGIDPSNQRLGLSPLNALLRELYGDIQAARYSARISRNFGVPPFALSPKESTNGVEVDTEKIKSKLMQAISGDNTGKPLVLTSAFDIHEFSAKPAEMEIESQRRIPEERLAAVIGIPAIVLGFGAGLARSTFSNTEQMQEYAYESYLIPLQRYIAEELELQLLPDFDSKANRSVSHDLSQVRALQEDKDALYKREGMAYTQGLKKRSEGRSALGLVSEKEDEVYFREPSQPQVQTPLRVVGKEDGLMPGKKDRPELKAVDRTLAREPTELEELVGYEDVLDEQDDSKEKISVVLLALTLLLGRQAVQMIGKLKPADFHTLTLDVPESSYASVRTEIEGAYIRGAELVRQELIRQKAPVSVIGESIAELTKVAEKEIDTITEATVSRVVNQIQASASASASSGVVVGEEGKEIQARVQTALREASTAPIENCARGAANASLNRGRNLEFEKILRDLEGSDEEQGVYFIYTAVGDGSTCFPCLSADGENSPDISDLDPTPNPSCSGWDRCRCWIIMAYSDNTSRDIRVGAA